MASALSYSQAVMGTGMIFAGMWVAMCGVAAVGMHLFARLRIMLACSYACRAAGVLLRQRRRRGTRRRPQQRRMTRPPASRARQTQVLETVTFEQVGDGQPR